MTRAPKKKKKRVETHNTRAHNTASHSTQSAGARESTHSLLKLRDLLLNGLSNSLHAVCDRRLHRAKGFKNGVHGLSQTCSLHSDKKREDEQENQKSGSSEEKCRHLNPPNEANSCLVCAHSLCFLALLPRSASSLPFVWFVWFVLCCVLRCQQSSGKPRKTFAIFLQLQRKESDGKKKKDKTQTQKHKEKKERGQTKEKEG